MSLPPFLRSPDPDWRLFTPQQKAALLALRARHRGWRSDEQDTSAMRGRRDAERWAERELARERSEDRADFEAKTWARGELE